MNAEEARKKLDELGIQYSSDHFFKSVQSGDRQGVELFLDAGFPPDALNKDRRAAVVIASESGKIDIARLLLTRGASSDPLLGKPKESKDRWDKITASSSILNFVSSLLIAAVGGWFTFSYNQRQMDLNRTQSEHDVAIKEQANRVLELEAIQKLIPLLTSGNEMQKAAALQAVQDLGSSQVAIHYAILFKGEGAIKYLEQAANSSNSEVKTIAVQALSSIEAKGGADAHMASQTLALLVQSGAPACSFYGEAPSGSPAWNKDEACSIPRVEILDPNYHQSNFNCCGGGATSPTTALDIPNGIELRISGKYYWSVSQPVLRGAKFSIHTYCGPPGNSWEGACKVRVEVIPHYRAQ